MYSISLDFVNKNNSKFHNIIFYCLDRLVSHVKHQALASNISKDVRLESHSNQGFCHSTDAKIGKISNLVLKLWHFEKSTNILVCLILGKIHKISLKCWLLWGFGNSRCCM